MGKRVAKNIAECAQYLKPPILCVGCGDGFEVECLAKGLNVPPLEEHVYGVEVTRERVKIAQENKLPVVLGAAENIPEIVGDRKFNIYCAHTLEHCFDIKKVIDNFKKIALDTIVIIVPIELKGRTRNRAHFSPVANLGSISNMFGMDYEITISYNWCIELQGRLIIKKDPMNWPRKIQDRSSELLIK